MKKLICLFLAIIMCFPMFVTNFVSADEDIALFRGVDIGQKDGYFDWESFDDCSEIDFAILRAWCGGKDLRFEDYYMEAQLRPVKLGAYADIFATTLSDAQLEANNIVRTVSGKSFYFPVFINVKNIETYASLGADNVSEIVKTELQIIKNAGFLPGVFTTADFAEKYINMSLLDEYFIWISDLGETVSYSGNYDMLQYGTIDSLYGGYYYADCCYVDPIAFWGQKNIIFNELNYGNFDDDREITATDALFVLNLSISEELIGNQLLLADVDENQEVDSVDALYVIKRSVGLIDVFPTEKSNGFNVVEINTQSFPDPVFIRDVKGADKNHDGYLSNKELARVSELNLYGGEYVYIEPYPPSPKIPTREKIHSLKGIEYFTSLKKLSCECNKISSLDLRDLPGLTELQCALCSMTELTTGAGLVKLMCAFNKLQSLDLTKSINLESVDCSLAKMESLDVSANAVLAELDCAGNDITALNLSKNGCLKKLSCEGNKLSVLDVSNNNQLTNLSCFNCGMSELIISNNPDLTYISCRNNNLTGLNLSKVPALVKLIVNGNSIEKLDLTNCPALKEITYDNGVSFTGWRDDIVGNVR